MAKLKGFDYKKAEADLDGVGARHPDEIYSYHSEKAVRGYMKEHGLNPDKYYKPDGKNTPSGSKENDNGGCYLTTACVAARGLPDTCAELQTLRAFRDGILTRRPGGPAGDCAVLPDRAGHCGGDQSSGGRRRDLEPRV